MINEQDTVSFSTQDEAQRRLDLVRLMESCPIPDHERLDNLGVFMTSKTWARLKFMDFIYQQIVEVPGVVMEFGTRWSQNPAMFMACRGLYEPYHRHRKIIAFDTFSGFPNVSPEDGRQGLMKPGGYSVTEGYRDYLQRVLELHEMENPLSHLRKFELVEGDVRERLPEYLESQPETIIALAYFDLDLYEPTKFCLETIKDRLVRGSILGFDELNEPATPGETKALMETIGLPNLRLRRMATTARTSYCIID